LKIDATMKTLRVGGQLLSGDILEELKQFSQQESVPSRTAVARQLCHQLQWLRTNGEPNLAKAQNVLGKLHKAGHLKLSAARGPRAGQPRRLCSTGQSLPPLGPIAGRVDQIQGLYLHRLNGWEDPLSPLWNEMIVQQHPLKAAPLVGSQLRYLIGSAHGWLGAIGFGPPAWHLGPRDQWIGWNSQARRLNLQRVIGLSRLLIRKEVRCSNLASKVMAMSLKRVGPDWQERYGHKPLLVESFVDRHQFTGRCYRAANWQLIGISQGRGRLGPKEGDSLKQKDIYVYPLESKAREQLQSQPVPLVQPRPLLEGVESGDWAQEEMAGLDLGDQRLEARAVKILQGRWDHPEKSYAQSFPDWGQVQGAYRLVDHPCKQIDLRALLAAHQERTCERMAAEPLVLLAQDTTSLNYSGLKKAEGLGKINHEGNLGLHLHSTLALNGAGVPLGVVDAQCWGREPEEQNPQGVGRNAKSVDQKESVRWVNSINRAAEMAVRMPQTTVVELGDRESDIYEVFDQVLIGPKNLHVVVRAQHNRTLKEQAKLWEYMAGQPVGGQLHLQVPRRLGRSARKAVLEVRWAEVTICASEVRLKRHWPALKLYAVWVKEIDPPPGEEPLEWMLLSDLPVRHWEEAVQRIAWYCLRWRIEEWHRVLKTGCRVEKREFGTALNLQRALAFDLIVACRTLMLVKLNRETPNLPATTLFTEEELAILRCYKKKADDPTNPTVRQATHWLAKLGGALLRKGDGEPGAEVIAQGFASLALLVAHHRLQLNEQ
jgi:Domain of unknown function (DUF4338)/Transposase DNA-binding/Transposase Tn5 dimerisation domain